MKKTWIDYLLPEVFGVKVGSLVGCKKLTADPG
jgi:hypothetical protein